MCLTIPAKVIKIQGNQAEILRNDQKILVNILAIPKVKVGAWILYISDFALKLISKKDAQEILELLESKPAIPVDNLDPKFSKIIAKLRSKRTISKPEIEYLLASQGNEEQALLSEADLARKTYIKDFICIHGIIEFSNYCHNDCFYCGIRRQSKSVKRYRLSEAEIINSAVEAADRGYKLLVLQSGEDLFYTTEKLVRIVRGIKAKSKVFLILSIGERDYDTYAELKKAGANGVLFRFETTNPTIFSQIHPKGKNLENRFNHLKFFKELGYFIATGSIVGLPGQTATDLADDILTTKKWANMVSFGPFVPCGDTPMGNDTSGNVETTLKMVAIFRLLNHKIKIPIATSLETIAPIDGRKRALSCGANSLMFDITPKQYRAHYKIYDNRYQSDEKTWEKYGLFQLESSYRMLEKKILDEMS